MGDATYYTDTVGIVTGANSGIGYALSEELLRRGAIVYMAGRSRQKIAGAAEQLAEYRIHPLVMDVTKQDQVQKGIEGAAAEAGRLDLLFNNAGSGAPCRLRRPPSMTGRRSSTPISGASSPASTPPCRSCSSRGPGIS